MDIYILRHAAAEPAGPGRPDPERALTTEGREKLRRVLKGARAAGVRPSLILSSPFKRAVETAEEAAKALGYQGRIERTASLTPDASPNEVWEEIRLRKDVDSVLLASHQPLVSSLAAYLLGVPPLDVDMKKSALLRVDCERFGPHPKGLLRWLITPAVAGE